MLQSEVAVKFVETQCR